MEDARQQESCCSFAYLFVGHALFFTGLATVLLSVALLTDYWEYVTFDTDQVQAVASAAVTTAGNHSVTWVSQRMGRLTFPSRMGNSTVKFGGGNVTGLAGHVDVAFLVAAHAGVFSLCNDLTEIERNLLITEGFSMPRCISYLTPEDIIYRNGWLDRMRNLAMSCAIVSLIVVFASAVLGVFGLTKRQISAIMVTGVMFLLSALFAIFTLACMQFKRMKPEGKSTSTVMDIGVPIEYLKARTFTAGWSVTVAWCGVAVCFVASIFWLVLARVLRFQFLTMT